MIIWVWVKIITSGDSTMARKLEVLPTEYEFEKDMFSTRDIDQGK
jgi:hypothetical protein